MNDKESPHPDAIRAHLDRVLTSPAFRTSKRSQKFLRYVVEQKLAGRGEEIKERSIGLEVFHRSSSYDPSEDSIVRVNANDVRKRLVQYYQHTESDIRIELPHGSYVPEFNFVSSTDSDGRSPAPDQRDGHRSRRTMVVLVLALVIVVGLSDLTLQHRLSRKTGLEQFWWPLTSSLREPIILVSTGPQVILPEGKQVFTLGAIRQVQDKNVATGDFLGIVAIATQLQRMGRACHIKPAAQLSLEELQSHPVVAIGMFDNPWTLQLNRDVRFVSHIDGDRPPYQYVISDRQQPARQWKAVGTGPLFPLEVETDYAVVTRLVDPTTHQVFVSAGGVSDRGTEAAADFLVTPSYWEKLAAQAPADWYRKNLQIVLEVRIVDDTAKPPVVVATHFW